MDRNKDIDNLRGLAMLAMIVIHACSYFLKTTTTYIVWNYLQWAVPVFLFCSFYITFANDKKIDVMKRLKRLYFPYSIFLAVYFILVFFFEKSKFNLPNFFANVFLYGGLDFNWLVLLFFYFTILIPIIRKLEKNKVLFYGFFGLSFLSSIIFIFFSPFNYRFDMWLPWSTYIYFTYFFVKNEKNKKLINATAVVSFAVFLFLYWLETKINHNLSQYGNKYPPTLFHISFGIFSTVALYQMAKIKVFNFLRFDKILDFLSLNSYPLFFIHLLVIFVLTWTKIVQKMNVFTFFLAIFGISCAVVLLMNASRTVFARLKSQI